MNHWVLNIVLIFFAVPLLAKAPNLFEKPIGRELIQPLLDRSPAKVNILQIPQMSREDFVLLRDWILQFQADPSPISYAQVLEKIASDRQLTKQIYRKFRENQRLIDLIVDQDPNSPIEDIRMDLVDSLETLHRKNGLFHRAGLFQYQDFEKFMEQHSDFKPQGIQASAFKLLLVYYFLNVSGQKKLDDKQMHRLNLLYRAAIPHHDIAGFSALNSTECKMALLSKDCKSLFYPNNGYVFGGAIASNGVARGLDCSSFGAFISGNEKQISTMALSYASRILTCSQEDYNYFKINDPNAEIRRQFFWRYGLKKAIDIYDPVVANKPSDLKVGDLVVSRNLSGRGGHFMIHLASDLIGDISSRRWFYGLEMTRGISRGIEELAIRRMKFDVEKKKLFFLRPRKVRTSRDLLNNRCATF